MLQNMDDVKIFESAAKQKNPWKTAKRIERKCYY